MKQAMDFKIAHQNADFIENEKNRHKQIDEIYEEKFRQQKIAFLFDYIQLRAEHQLQKTGSAEVSLRNYNYSFYSSKINDLGVRYSYADTFKDMVAGCEASAVAFRQWLKENDLDIYVYEQDDGFGERSWVEIRFKIKQ